MFEDMEVPAFLEKMRQIWSGGLLQVFENFAAERFWKAQIAISRDGWKARARLCDKAR